MKKWINDDALFATMKQELFPAVVGDVMDQAGLVNQFLPPQIRPLHHAMIVVGRAMTVLEADIDDNMNTQLLEKPFGLMLEALDDLKQNEVYICTGASPTYALWGELMSTRAEKLGCTGAVVNGYSRDTKGVIQLNFPTFSYGGYSQDQGPRGKVIDFRTTIKLGEVTVKPGDIIFGDVDGVCIIPQDREEEIITKAIEKSLKENIVKLKIKEGMSACAAFSAYGVM